MMSEEEVHSGEIADTMVQLNTAWERRKARLLRLLQESPLDRWLRRRR